MRRRLPIVVRAQHDHRFGSCQGELTLEDGYIQFGSREHGQWRWVFDQIVQMEREDSRHVMLRSEERDSLKLGGSKTFRFELDTPIGLETWNAYRTLANR